VNPPQYARSGSTLSAVLIFASVGLIVVTLYLAHQARSSAQALRSPAALQALLNARSGIYHGIEILEFGDARDTSDIIDTISALDHLFRMDMFNGVEQDTTGSDEFTDMNIAKTAFLYTDDSVNVSEITTSVHGIYNLITSVSTVNDIKRTVEALLGCGPPAKPDTVLILENNLPVTGQFRGKAHQEIKALDTLSGTTGKPYSKSLEERVKSFISEINNQNSTAEDSTIFDVPLTIQSSSALGTIPDTVKGHLLLDGAFSEVVWREKRKIIIYGDLQITGSFKLQDLELSAGGEIRILDKASLINVSLFSKNRIFIGDNAVFQGNGLSMGSINVYGKAEIKGKSSLIATGSLSNQSKHNNYSIFISESSTFDGTAVALGNPGGIKTDPDTKLKGILWAQKLVCHSGKLSGIIRARYLFDCSNSSSDSIVNVSKLTENSFTGTIEPLSSIVNYKMPYFMGALQIINWREF
jgi:hypothetical protein